MRGWIKRLERAAGEEIIVIPQKDGTVARFSEEAFEECFLHEYERGRRHHEGEDPGPAHPMIDALRNAKDLEALMPGHGTILGALVAEDTVYRGERERPRPPVREVGSGHYE